MARPVLVATILLGTAAAAFGQLQLPDQVRAGMTARLSVRLADRSVGPGLAAATYRLSVDGPATLEVEPAQLGGTAASWRATSTDSDRREGDRLTRTEEIALTQTRAGPVDLPSLSVRFRASPSDPWEEPVTWSGLAQPLETLAPDALPVVPPWSPPRWFWPAVAGAVVAPLLLVGAWWLSRPRPAASLTPRQRALRELAGLEDRLDQLGSESYHTQLSAIVRRFLVERYELPAEQQTTAEFLIGAPHALALSGDQRDTLMQILERCDLAKFAPVSATADEGRQTTSLARRLVEGSTEQKLAS
jgi:hypothetical protein